MDINRTSLFSPLLLTHPHLPTSCAPQCHDLLRKRKTTLVLEQKLRGHVLLVNVSPQKRFQPPVRINQSYVHLTESNAGAEQAASAERREARKARKAERARRAMDDSDDERDDNEDESGASTTVSLPLLNQSKQS